MTAQTLSRYLTIKDRRLVRTAPVYYGWIVVAAATVVMAMTIPAQTVGISLFIGFVLMRGPGPGALSLVSIHVVNLWFVRRRGTAVGWMYVGLAAMTGVFPLLIEWLLMQVGWRNAFFIVGAGLFVIVQGMQSAILGSAYAQYFGREHIGAIKGFAKTIFVAGTALGPVVYAVGFEVIGSYTLPLVLTAAAPLTVGVAALLTRHQS